jgi:protein required for attachment to host cells
MKAKWILVAHRGGARLFHWLASEKRLTLNMKVDFPEGHAARNLGSSNHAKLTSAEGSGTMFLPQDQSHGEAAAGALCNELARLLKKKHAERPHNELVLVAGPHLLGMLKRALDKDVTRIVVGSVDKDLAHVPDSEILDHLDLEELENASLELESAQP